MINEIVSCLTGTSNRVSCEPMEQFRYSGGKIFLIFSPLFVSVFMRHNINYRIMIKREYFIFSAYGY